MRKKLSILLLGLFMFAAFVFFSFLVNKHVFAGLDFDTTVRLQNHISRKFDTFFSVFSLIGSAEVATVILLAILFLMKKLKGLIILFGYGLILAFELFGKFMVKHLGPPYMFFRYNIKFVFPSSYVQPGYSYPSGHSARTLFISVIAAFFIGKSKKLSRTNKFIILGLIILFDVTMLVSRVYLGEHWTTDVIGGGLLGAGLGFLSLVFY